MLPAIWVMAMSREPTDSGPGLAVDHNEAKRTVSKMVRLTTSLVGQQYCTQVVDRNNHYGKLRLKLKLTLRNISRENLVIHRFDNPIFRVVLIKGPTAVRAGRTVYDQWSSVMRKRFFASRDFLEPEPTDEFVILKPESAHDYEYDQEIDIALKDLGNPAWTLRSGDYLLRIKIKTWSWRPEKAAELQKRWAQYGYFWYYDIMSTPMPLHVEIPRSRIAICQ